MAQPVKSKSKALVTDDKVMVPHSSEDASDVDNTVNQYMGTGEDGRNECTVCGKKQGNESGAKSNLKRHIETHLEGLSFSCQLCGKTFRSTNSFNTHKTRFHK